MNITIAVDGTEVTTASAQALQYGALRDLANLYGQRLLDAAEMFTWDTIDTEWNDEACSGMEFKDGSVYFDDNDHNGRDHVNHCAFATAYDFLGHYEDEASYPSSFTDWYNGIAKREQERSIKAEQDRKRRETERSENENNELLARASEKLEAIVQGKQQRLGAVEVVEISSTK